MAQWAAALLMVMVHGGKVLPAGRLVPISLPHWHGWCALEAPGQGRRQKKDGNGAVSKVRAPSREQARVC